MINLTSLTQSDKFIRNALEDKLMIPFLGYHILEIQYIFACISNHSLLKMQQQ